MPLNIRIQRNAGTACVSECVLKTLACRLRFAKLLTSFSYCTSCTNTGEKTTRNGSQPTSSFTKIQEISDSLHRLQRSLKPLSTCKNQYLSLQSNLKHGWFARKFAKHISNTPVRMNFLPPALVFKVKSQESSYEPGGSDVVRELSRERGMFQNGMQREGLKEV